METKQHTFADVLEHFGTHEKMADALGCSRAAVTMWKGKFPHLRTFQIEVVTAGKFKADRLPCDRTVAE